MLNNAVIVKVSADVFVESTVSEVVAWLEENIGTYKISWEWGSGYIAVDDNLYTNDLKLMLKLRFGI